MLINDLYRQQKQTARSKCRKYKMKERKQKTRIKQAHLKIALKNAYTD